MMEIPRVILFLYLLTRLAITYGKSVTDNKEERSLSCYHCYSNKSWENCNDQVKGVICPDDNNVCTEKKITRKIKQNDKRVQITEFVKQCDHAEGCSDEECKELGWSCVVKCCNQDMCNTCVVNTASLVVMATAILTGLSLGP
ncbi:unnamed protein product [Porites evermanni]|uniref:Snake toxin/toxin-like domain-containing protein n=1 Tax=Porites evermanni TaxID=104178 RepID=A0ABN8LDU5_9CNID|nr:unnamed protein product [Porites evermanni]